MTFEFADSLSALQFLPIEKARNC